MRSALLFFIQLCIGTFAHANASAVESSPSAPDKYEMPQDGVDPFEGTVARVEGFLLAFRNQNAGQWPRNWGELEKQFGNRIWSEAESKRRMTREFVLLPGIEGTISTAREGSFRAQLMMVGVGPSPRHLAGSAPEIGRWVIWKTSGGIIGRGWHAESEIQTFSELPKVQAEISQFLVTVRAEDSGDRAISTGQTLPQEFAPTLPSKAHETNSARSDSESASSKPWSIIVVLIVAVGGLLWLLLKRRAK